MLTLTRIFFFTLLLLKATLGFALPKHVTLEYEVTRDGKPFASVKETFSQDGTQYRVESITKGVGFYALFGERKLTSVGEVTDDGLKPTHFELHQGDHAKKSLISDFDWQNKTLNMQVKGKTKTAALEQGTQDLASYAYQFMFAPPRTPDIKVTLTTGKKLNQYIYQALPSITLHIGSKRYQTLHLMSATTDTTEGKQLWLAQDLYFLPLKITMSDDNGAKIEQSVTNIHVE